ELQQGLIGTDRVPGLLEPLADSRFGHRLAERRHRDLDRHLFPPSQSESAWATSAFCSWLCLLAWPVAVAAVAGRPTYRGRVLRGDSRCCSTHSMLGSTKLQAPMFLGSSCAHTISACGKRESSVINARAGNG